MAGRELRHRRHVAAALVAGQRTARMEAAAGRRVGKVGRRARQRLPWARYRPAAAGWRSGARYRDAAVGGRRRRVRPSSTRRPPYMMPRRSARLACTAMSWVTKMTEEPSSRCTEWIIASTPFWTTTSSAVVGSSAMMNSGRQTVASAMVDALAHAARQLVRIGVEHAGFEVQALQMRAHDGRETPASTCRCGGRRSRRRRGASGAPGSARSSSPA